jgi:hypothetical protein
MSMERGGGQRSDILTGIIDYVDSIFKMALILVVHGAMGSPTLE